MAKEKKPKGWYGKAAKAERRTVRERRDRLRAVERAKKGWTKADALSPAERAEAAATRARRLADAQERADRLAESVERKAAGGRASRAQADRNYTRAAKKLRQELQPKLSGVDMGTPHTRRHHRKTSFERLVEARCVTGEMIMAAQEIERVYLALCGSMVLRAAQMEAAGRGSPRPMSDETALAHARRYRPWAAALGRLSDGGDWPFLEIVIDVAVDGRSLREVEEHKGMRNGSARFALCWALLSYAVLARWSPEAELAAYEAAHDVHRRLRRAA